MHPTRMSGVVMTGHGGPERLEWRDDLPVVAPEQGDVLIAVAAAAVNNTDINTRIGWYDRDDGRDDDDGDGSGADDDGEVGGWAGEPMSFPRIQGADICGRVVAAGPDVDPGRVGERVIVEPVLTEWHGRPLETTWYVGSECDGGFAEYVCIPSRHAHRVDISMSDVELASFPCSASTAENLLTRASVGAGDTVLVTGASGGVGSAAVQLARARGAEVIAVAGAAKAADVLALGASSHVDRGADLVDTLGRNAVDVVVDLVGGPAWPRLLDVLRPTGRYAVSGAIAGHMVELDLRTLYLKDLSFFGCTVLDAGVFVQLVRRIEAGDIRPVVASTYPLPSIAEAQEAFQTKAHTGKIVLTVGDLR